jgi:hypothetical protein
MPSLRLVRVRISIGMLKLVVRSPLSPFFGALSMYEEHGESMKEERGETVMRLGHWLIRTQQCLRSRAPGCDSHLPCDDCWYKNYWPVDSWVRLQSAKYNIWDRLSWVKRQMLMSGCAETEKAS